MAWRRKENVYAVCYHINVCVNIIYFRVFLCRTTEYWRKEQWSIWVLQSFRSGGCFNSSAAKNLGTASFEECINIQTDSLAHFKGLKTSISHLFNCGLRQFSLTGEVSWLHVVFFRCLHSGGSDNSLHEVKDVNTF